MIWNIAVDCEWDEWQIGECSKSCGIGIRTDVRKIKTNSSNGGKDCQGLSIIEDNCNVEECPGTLLDIMYIQMRNLDNLSCLSWF